MDESSDRRPDPPADAVGAWLADCGVEVYRIPETSAHRTPDFRVSIGSESALVEVKSRRDDEQLRRIVDDVPGETRAYSGRRTREIVEDAWRQIRDYPERVGNDFALVWFDAASRTPGGVLSPGALRAQLYGLQRIESTTSSGGVVEAECYFFHESVFHRRDELDAVFISSPTHLTACLNPLSMQYSDFRFSALIAALRASMEVEDPRQRESKGEALIADFPGDRRRLAVTAARLREQYGLGRLDLLQYKLFNHPA